MYHTGLPCRTTRCLLLESEARLAAAALGLDPGLGVLHLDTPNRDSLACDLMEAVRPQVDRLRPGVDHSAAVTQGMVFRATQRQPPPDGIIRRSAL